MMEARNDRSDIDLDLVAELTYSAVFSDVCDALGFRDQTVAPHIRHLCGPSTLVGWARTFLTAGVDQAPQRPYGTEIDFIDRLCPGDVAVGTANDRPAAAWGELFSTAALGRGARGAVVDGLVRDIDKIGAIDFPIHAAGTRPTDSLGRVSLTSWDVPVPIGGVTVSPGDLVVGDSDGITFVPQEIAVEAVALAIQKATTESHARELLLGGGKLADVWERYQVL